MNCFLQKSKSFMLPSTLARNASAVCIWGQPNITFTAFAAHNESISVTYGC